MGDSDKEGNMEGRFNLTKFLRINSNKFDSVRKVWDAKKTIASDQGQITRGILELETIYNNLQKEKGSPPINKLMISWQLLMKLGSIPKTFPYPNSPNNYFRIKQGKSLEDVLLEEGRGTLNSDTDADIEELAEEIKQK